MKYALLIMALLAPRIAIASDWKVIVLRVDEVSELSNAMYLIRMENGDAVSVSKENIDFKMSEVVDGVYKKQQIGAASTDTTRTDDSSAVRSYCSKEWPDDYKMQQYCIGQQREARARLASRSMPGALVPIRNNCARDWPEDYKMRDYCEIQQIKAFQELNR